MVKFSKELEAQLIPEWKEAFVNYWQLKKHVKKIKLSRKPTKPSHPEALIRWGLVSFIFFDPLRSVAKKIVSRSRGSINGGNDTVPQVVIRVCERARKIHALMNEGKSLHFRFQFSCC